MNRRPLIGLAILASIFTWIRPVHADGEFVIESHVNRQAEPTRATMTQLLVSLHALGVAPNSQLMERLADRAPRPGVLDPKLTANEITSAVDAGYGKWLNLEFRVAATTLEAIITKAQRNPALIVMDTKYRTVMYRALLGLALSRGRLSDVAGAELTMAEMIRSYPDQPITRGQYGPEAERLYIGVRKSLEATGRGTLKITVTNPQTIIFVNEQIRGLGSATLLDLFPGAYRVFLQEPGTAERQYSVRVFPKRESQTAIDWELDSIFAISDDWAGFLFPTEADRAREAQLSAHVSKQLHSSGLIVLESILSQAGNAIRGVRYRADGAIDRSAVISIQDRSTERAAALAGFLVDGTPSTLLQQSTNIAPSPKNDSSPKGFKDDKSARSPIQLRTDTGSPRSGPWFSVSLIGAGVAVAGVGGFLLWRDGRSSCASATPFEDCPTVYTSKFEGYLGLGSGIAVIGVGIAFYLFRNDDSHTHVSLAPTRDGGLAVAGWTF